MVYRIGKRWFDVRKYWEDSRLRRSLLGCGAYKEELKTRPVEDLVEQMEESDVRISPVAGSRHMFSITVKAPEAAGAQGAAQSLAASFIDGTDFWIKNRRICRRIRKVLGDRDIALIGLGEVRWPRC